MLQRFHKWLRARRRAIPRPRYTQRFYLEPLEDRYLLSGAYLQTNLLSDLPGVAAKVDTNTPPQLVNAWGLAAGPTTPWWVADNGTGLSTLYDGQGNQQSLVVTIPPPASTPGATAAPTGLVFNTSTSGFNVSEGSNSGKAFFLFATEDGTISGWNPTVDLHHAIREVDNSASGAVYKGLALVPSTSQGPLLYATNFRAGTVDVFDQNFNPVTLSAHAFQDSHIPAGYAPFGIANINGLLYVTYAEQDSARHDDVAGIGHGFIDIYRPDGTLMTRFASHGPLDSPWGLALAPSNFGKFSDDLLVGNFGNGHIEAYDPNTRQLVGLMKDATGHPLAIDGLWSLAFGNDHAAGSSHTLFFTAGPDEESHGLFGSIQAIPDAANDSSVVPNLPGAAFQSVSTVPSNGDVNPYGVAFVPQSYHGGGVLQPGDVLVSNFNNSSNLQGTGTTIVRITPQGGTSVFFQGKNLGLTTALGVLRNGFVIVGNMPTSDGTSATIRPGSLLILDGNGKVVSRLSDSALLDGPWDLTINDQGSRAEVFVSNVLNGTVTRIDLSIPQGGTPQVMSETRIASGYAHRSDPNALVVGPTGLAFDAAHDILYVASTADNAVFAIPNALTSHGDHGMGRLVYNDPAHLRGPLGLVLAPNGDLVTTNGDAVNGDPSQPSEIVEFTPQGQFVGQTSVDPAQGAAFGIGLQNVGGTIRFAAVDDATNVLDIWTFHIKKDGEMDT